MSRIGVNISPAFVNRYRLDIFACRCLLRNQESGIESGPIFAGFRITSSYHRVGLQGIREFNSGDMLLFCLEKRFRGRPRYALNRVNRKSGAIHLFFRCPYPRFLGRHNAVSSSDAFGLFPDGLLPKSLRSVLKRCDTTLMTKPRP